MNTPGAKMLIVTFDRHCSCLAACCCTPDTRQERATVSGAWEEGTLIPTSRNKHLFHLCWAGLWGYRCMREHMWGGGSQGSSRAAVSWALPHSKTWPRRFSTDGPSTGHALTPPHPQLYSLYSNLHSGTAARSGHIRRSINECSNVEELRMQLPSLQGELLAIPHRRLSYLATPQDQFPSLRENSVPSMHIKLYLIKKKAKNF